MTFSTDGPKDYQAGLNIAQPGLLTLPGRSTSSPLNSPLNSGPHKAETEVSAAHGICWPCWGPIHVRGHSRKVCGLGYKLSGLDLD